MPLSPVFLSEKAIFLVRQQFAHNLADRFYTHPFLTLIEKRWLAYQLLVAVSQMHAAGVRHGDIKSGTRPQRQGQSASGLGRVMV